MNARAAILVLFPISQDPGVKISLAAVVKGILN